MTNSELIKKEWKENNFSSEYQFQSAAILLISQHFPLFRNKVFHVKNENLIPKKDGESEMEYSKRCKRQGNLNKSQGVLAGVPDILIVHNGILYKIELKQPDGKFQKSQERIHPIWNQDCPLIPVQICRTLEDIFLYCTWIMSKNYKIAF